jgi:hypothetical protein
VPPWEACLPLLQVDKKAVQGKDGAGTAIHCILPRPRARAEQRLLPPQAWRGPHTHLQALLLDTGNPT